MSYSCTDFTDSILDALHIEVPEKDWDSPSAQADLALAEIDRLQRLVRDLAGMTIDGDIVDGVEYEADGNDEEIDRLYGFVHRARALLNLNDPKQTYTEPT